MTAAIEIAVEAAAWAAIPDAEETVRRAVAAALADAAPDGEISVLLTGDAEMRVLNRTWRGVDAATNVLSFPAPPKSGGFLGDVVLACETVVREAEAERKAVRHHLAHLAVHGTLHLVGLDHGSDADAAAMEARERAILAGLGVPDPYAGADPLRTERA